MSQPDGVTVDEAYAAALEEIGRLQTRLILGQALIAKLKREGVDCGQAHESDTGDERGGDSPYHFSD